MGQPRSRFRTRPTRPGSSSTPRYANRSTGVMRASGRCLCWPGAPGRRRGRCSCRRSPCSVWTTTLRRKQAAGTLFGSARTLQLRCCIESEKRSEILKHCPTDFVFLLVPKVSKLGNHQPRVPGIEGFAI